jgi:hypothetical protein
VRAFARASSLVIKTAGLGLQQKVLFDIQGICGGFSFKPSHAWAPKFERRGKPEKPISHKPLKSVFSAPDISRPLSRNFRRAGVKQPVAVKTSTPLPG